MYVCTYISISALDAQTRHPGDVSQQSATVTTGSKGGVVAKADAATLSKSFAAWGGTGIRARFVWAVACAAMSHAGGGGGGGGGGIGGDVSKGSESGSEGAGTEGAEGVDTGELAPEARMNVMALHRSGKSAAQIRCLCLCVCVRACVRACVRVCVCIM
jgi:hypothetical protein